MDRGGNLTLKLLALGFGSSSLHEVSSRIGMKTLLARYLRKLRVGLDIVFQQRWVIIPRVFWVNNMSETRNGCGKAVVFKVLKECNTEEGVLDRSSILVLYRGEIHDKTRKVHHRRSRM